MNERKKIIFGGGRQQGKTEQMCETTKAAIKDRKQIYLPKTPPIANNDPDGDESNQS